MWRRILQNVGSAVARMGVTLALAAGAAAAQEPAPAVPMCGPNEACRSFGDNTNFFDLTQVRAWDPRVTCEIADYRRTFGRVPCPLGMAWVCAPHRGVNMCIDRELRQGRDRKPLGGQTKAACESYCRAQGKRLPLNNEWLTACEGSEPAQCLPARISHPIAAKLAGAAPWRVDGVDCKAKGATWGRTCMNDLSLNASLPARRAQCLSAHGARDMIGVLGQWVADEPRGRGQFNGGLWPQAKSSCAYTTVAHGPGWSDYSIGCRCAQDAGQTATARR